MPFYRLTVDLYRVRGIMNPYTQRTRGQTMTYEKACEILGFTTPKSLKANARLAESRLSNAAPGAPLRYSVACKVIINAGK